MLTTINSTLRAYTHIHKHTVHTHTHTYSTHLHTHIQYTLTKTYSTHKHTVHTYTNTQTNIHRHLHTHTNKYIVHTYTQTNKHTVQTYTCTQTHTQTYSTHLHTHTPTKSFQTQCAVQRWNKSVRSKGLHSIMSESESDLLAKYVNTHTRNLAFGGDSSNPDNIQTMYILFTDNTIYGLYKKQTIYIKCKCVW